MPIVLPFDLTIQAIRVLQEFKRLNADSLPVATLKAIKHPSGGGEAPAVELAGKGYLAADEKENFALTQKGKDFLAVQAAPAGESSVSEGSEPAE